MQSKQKNPKAKEIIQLLGVGAVLIATFVFPALPLAAKPILDFYRKKEIEDHKSRWKKYNKSKLVYLLKRLQMQKMVEVIDDNGIPVLKLTEKGKTKYLKYNLEQLKLFRPTSWDGKWRIIIYDIQKEKRQLSEIFRKQLRDLSFLKLQKSVYLTPYPCKNEIEYLRQIHNLPAEVIYLEAETIENASAYKTYFGLS